MTHPDFVLCVDPGKMTGICLYDWRGDDPSIAWSDELEFMDTCHRVNATLQQCDSVVLVCESFIITPQTAKNSVAPWSLELIGVMKYLTGALGKPAPVMQTAGDAKRFCDNDRLRALGLWHRGGAGHARDALRHGVLYMVRAGWQPKNLLQ